MDTVNERITTVEDGPGTVNERLSTGGPGPEGQPDTVTEGLSGAPAPLDPPAASANKSEWVDYAVSQGSSRDEAEAMTKAELVEQYQS
ncbi:MAG TPA: hypothetical protein VN088_08485 [Nocardioides sp.]|nr:hypothetical protein [Nocardioides sp.]